MVVFARDGSTIEVVLVPLTTGPETISYAHPGTTDGIAGFSLFNANGGGIGIDNLVFGATTEDFNSLTFDPLVAGETGHDGIIGLTGVSVGERFLGQSNNPVGDFDILGTTASSAGGVSRIQIDWDVTGLPPDPDDIDEATVTLHTNRGSGDSLNTVFFVGAGNGILEASDFEAPASAGALPNVVMDVFGTVGQDGTFRFDVTDQVQEAIAAGADFFSLKGRIEDEATSSDGVGLRIRSTAGVNLTAGTEPQLEVVTTAEVLPPVDLVFTVTSTLTFGATLTNLSGASVPVGTTFSSPTTLVVTPAVGFVGTTMFTYSVTENGLVIDSATVSVLVADDGCASVGRPPGCTIP